MALKTSRIEWHQFCRHHVRGFMKLYKLTDQNAQTMYQTQWGEGVTHETSGEGALCGSGWLHAYEHPLLAVLLNPIHADFQAARMWESEGSGETLRDGQLKIGVTKLTTLREIQVPIVTTEQRVRFAILCAKTVYKSHNWNKWADGWLDGSERSTAAAETAAAAAAAAWAAQAAWAAAWAAAAGLGVNLAAIAEEACK
jgi:hypothetical protein